MNKTFQKTWLDDKKYVNFLGIRICTNLLALPLFLVLTKNRISIYLLCFEFYYNKSVEPFKNE